MWNYVLKQIQIQMQLKAFEWEQFNAMDGTVLHCIVQLKHCWSLDPLTWFVADSAM